VNTFMLCRELEESAMDYSWLDEVFGVLFSYKCFLIHERNQVGFNEM
jgi:hypothetical protein